MLNGLDRRRGNFIGFAICASLMAFALYSQHVNGLEPCPLCVLQRLAIIGVGVVFLLAALHNPGKIGARVYGLLILVPAGLGAAVAGRHVQIQNMPADELPSCGPGLEYMLDAFPLRDVLDMVLKGSGECAEIDWVFLGLSMPGWVFVTVVLLGLAGLIGNWKISR